MNVREGINELKAEQKVRSKPRSITKKLQETLQANQEELKSTTRRVKSKSNNNAI